MPVETEVDSSGAGYHLNLEGIRSRLGQSGQGRTSERIRTTATDRDHNYCGQYKAQDDRFHVLDGLNFASEVYNLTADPMEQDNLAKDSKSTRDYYARYGFILYRWYNCQLKYYAKEKYKDEEAINCN